MKLKIYPRHAAVWLGSLALYLAAQSVLNEYLLENVLSEETSSVAWALLDLFSVNSEETIPTWYSTLLLFVAALLLFLIYRAKRREQDLYTAFWLGLSGIFLYLSMDEGAVIHEIFSDPLQARFETVGYLSFAWILLFVPLGLIIFLLYFRFLLHLLPTIRNLMIGAGVVYVGGAVGVEAISANRWYLDGGVTFPYLAIATVEELLEMLGVVLFIFALLRYMAQMELTAVLTPTHPSPPLDLAKARWPRVVLPLLLLGNGLLLFWAFSQPAETADFTPESALFYETVRERYAGQGVIILGLGELLEPANPNAPATAAALLTLFDDVLVVNLPDQQTSVVFASSLLPFDALTLAELVEESGQREFGLLDITAVRALAAEP